MFIQVSLGPFLDNIVLLLITVRRRHEIFGPLTARNWTPDCGLGALIGYIKKCPTKTRLVST